MSKKRKCKYTAEELAIHEEAVRLRKMTDKQLVEEFHRAADTDIGLSTTKTAQGASDETKAIKDTSTVQKLLTALSEGKCKGIKGATIYKITQFAAEMGLM